MIRCFAAALLLMSLFPPVAPAEDLHSLAAAVDDHYNHLRTLRTEFTETYRGSGMDRTESGTLWLSKASLKKPGKMRWEYRSPKEKLFVSDGTSAWFYIPADRQARKQDARKLEDIRSPLAFLLGKSKLEKELQGLSIAPDIKPETAGDTVLRGIPVAMADRIADITLEINPGHEIVRIIINNVDGSSTEYDFSNQEENVAISQGQFEFKAPAGTEVIEGGMEE